jgi:hypothetical protein
MNKSVFQKSGKQMTIDRTSGNITRPISPQKIIFTRTNTESEIMNLYASQRKQHDRNNSHIVLPKSMKRDFMLE